MVTVLNKQVLDNSYGTAKSCEKSNIKFGSGLNLFCKNKTEETYEQKEKRLAKEIYESGQKKFPEAKQQIQKMFPDNKLDFRLKDEINVADHLRAVHKMLRKDYKNDEEAWKTLDDLFRGRIILNTDKPNDVDNVVDSLVNAIRSGEITVYKVFNMTTSGSKPYLTKEHLKKLNEAAADKGVKISYPIINRINPIGATTGMVYVQFNNGLRGELQLRGPETNRIINAARPLFFLIDGRNVDQGNEEIQELFKPVNDAAKKLSLLDKAKYLKYFVNSMKYARELEVGNTEAKKPQLPKGIDTVLDLDNLDNVIQKHYAFKKRESKVDVSV